MSAKTTWNALCAAAVLALAAIVTASAQPEAPPQKPNQVTPACAPNPWVTGGFCKKITIFNRYYCEWPCGVPPVEQPYLGSSNSDSSDDDTPSDDTASDDASPN